MNIFTKEIGERLKLICVGISGRYENQFVEIGYESDYVHFLVQSVPSISVSKLVTLIKSLSARELFKAAPEIKKILWEGNLWTSGYYSNTVGQYGNQDVIRKYIENQGKEEYKNLFAWSKIENTPHRGVFFLLLVFRQILQLFFYNFFSNFFSIFQSKFYYIYT